MFIPIWMIILIAVLVISLVFVLILIIFSKINKTNELIKKLDNRLEKMSSNLKLYAEKVSSEPKSVDKTASNEDSFITLSFMWFRDINTYMTFFTFMSYAVYSILFNAFHLDINEHDRLIKIIIGVIGFFLAGILIWKMQFDRKKIIKNVWNEIFAVLALFVLSLLIGSSLARSLLS